MLMKKEYYVIGDGNCGPRAIIQSLLLEGLAYPQHRQFVCDFLRGIYQRNKDNTEPYEDNIQHIFNIKTDEIFGSHDPRPKATMFSDTVYRLPFTQKNTLEKQILIFIDTYEKMAPTENNMDLLIEKFIPKNRGIPPSHDHLIYLLAAYLRFDICTEICAENTDPVIQMFHRKILPDLIEFGQQGFRPSINEIIESNNLLERNTDAAYIACYLAKHGIGYLLLDKNTHGELASNSIYFDLKHAAFTITTLTTGLHFSVQWSRPSLSIRSETNLTNALPQPNIHSQRPCHSLNMRILNKFLVALGVFAVAIALIALSFKAGMIVASIGIVSIALGGYGLFKQSEQTRENPVLAPLVSSYCQI